MSILIMSGPFPWKVNCAMNLSIFTMSGTRTTSGATNLSTFTMSGTLPERICQGCRGGAPPLETKMCSQFVSPYYVWDEDYCGCFDVSISTMSRTLPEKFARATAGGPSPWKIGFAVNLSIFTMSGAKARTASASSGL